MAELNDKLITYGNLSTFHDNLINDSVTSGNSTWSSEKIASEIQQGGGGGGSATIENVTYAQLKALRDNSQLVKGQQYRITDYVTTCGENAVGVYDSPARSAGHQFDIIVIADDVDKLNENARAINHPGVIISNVIHYHEDYYKNYYSGYNDFPYAGTIEIDGTTYYKWGQNDGSYGGMYYLLTTESSYTNEPDGEDDCGVYYLNTYPIAGALSDDGETSTEFYSVWSRKHKSIINTVEDNGTLYLRIADAYDCATESIQEEYTSTDYFWKNDLASWKLKYSLDNDIDRFSWADTNENPGLGFAAIKVNTTKTENVSKLIIGDNMNPRGDEFGNEHYYIDNEAYEHVYQGTINYGGTTYYKWYEEYKNKTVLTTQATYSNSPSGTDEDGFTYYDNVYSIVGTITIDGETFDEFYKRDKKIIKTETSQVENNGSFLYKRYQAGDTSNTYAWVSVNYSFNKDINDAAVNWSDVDTTDIIYTDSETPSLDTVISGATIIEYSANVQENLPKGVIFDMIDEWNNHLNYDFKNIQYYNEDDDIWNYTFDDLDDIDNTLFGDSNNNNFISTISDGGFSLYKYAGVDKVGQSNLINIPVYNESTSIKINQISENNYTISANVRNPINITSNGIGLNYDNNAGLGIESEHGRLVVTPASSSKIGGVKIASDLFNIDEKGNISINLLKLRDTLSSEIMDYLTFEAINQTTIHFYGEKTIETSKDGKNWTSYSNGGIVGSLEQGEKLYVRGDNTCYAIAGFNGSSGSYHSNSHFTVSDDCYLYGNIMSLINSTDYPNCNSLYHELHMNGNTWWYEEGFRGLFYSCTHLYSHPNKDLILPVKNLITNCYKDLFKNCNNITRIKCLAQNIYYQNEICTTDWLKGASSSGTLITPQSTNWITGDSGIPEGWTRENS